MPTYKILLIGDEQSGKTSLLRRIITNSFDVNYVPTLGVEVHPYRIGTPLDTKAIFNFWDCAGDERFVGLGRGYYKGAQGVIFCFDLTSPSSLKKLNFYIREVQDVVGDISFIIVGCKCDLPNALENAKNMDFDLTLICSSLNGINTSNICTKLLMKLQ